MAIKKGIFFTLIALGMVFMLLMSVPILLRTNQKSSQQVSSRIWLVDKTIEDVKTDFKREIQISGYRSIISNLEYISTNGNYLSDSSSLNSAFKNGTIGNKTLSTMSGSTFEDWSLKIKNQLSTLQIDANITLENVSFIQTNPWSVTVIATANFQIGDFGGLAYWNMSNTDNAIISILGFEDPVYIIGSSNRVSHPINLTPYSLDFTSSNDATNLVNHMLKGYYLESNTAPDFLQRLHGNLTLNSSNGIESLVDLSTLDALGISTHSGTIVDYIYFGNFSSTNHLINTTPPNQYSWFYLDDLHITPYMVNSRLLT